MLLYLRHIDPEQNCRRHYLLTWQYDLAGRLVVVRRWGRLGAPRWQGSLTTQVESAEEAIQLTRALLKRRRRHGYFVVECSGADNALFDPEN